MATCGTALTEEHFRTLKSFAHRVVLAFDADAAGQSAAARFYEWERAYEIDVAVAALPPGVDPADLARSDPAALAAAVEGATPFLGFRVNRVLEAASLVSPEGRARAAETAIAVLDEHPNPLVRDQYLMEVASRCRIPVEQLRAGTFARAPSEARGDTRGRAVAVDRATVRPPRRPDSPEVEALRLLLDDPDIDRAQARRAAVRRRRQPRGVPGAHLDVDAARGGRAAPTGRRPSCCSDSRSRTPRPTPPRSWRASSKRRLGASWP